MTGLVGDKVKIIARDGLVIVSSAQGFLGIYNYNLELQESWALAQQDLDPYNLALNVRSADQYEVYYAGRKSIGMIRKTTNLDGEPVFNNQPNIFEMDPAPQDATKAHQIYLSVSGDYLSWKTQSEQYLYTTAVCAPGFSWTDY